MEAFWCENPYFYVFRLVAVVNLTYVASTLNMVKSQKVVALMFTASWNFDSSGKKSRKNQGILFHEMLGAKFS